MRFNADQIADNKLVELTLAGDRDAFGYIVDRYSALLARVVAEIVRFQEDVEDIVQECFVRAYSSLDTYRNDSQFRTWLLRIAHNTAVTRSQQHVRRDATVAHDSEAVSLAADDEAVLPDELLGSRELEERVASCIDDLAEHYRVVLKLYYYEEFTYPEIAEVLGKPMNTVKSHLSRAKARLKRLLVADSALKELTAHGG